MDYPYPEPSLSEEHRTWEGGFTPPPPGAGLPVAETAAAYLPRHPKESILYGVVAIAAGDYHSLAIKGVRDTTPPVITPSVSPAPVNGWNISLVTVSWTVTDPESGIASTTGCDSMTNWADTAGATITCSATNGAGLHASSSVMVKLDKSPPNIVSLTSNPSSLWPPNHKIVDVVVAAQTTDAVSGSVSVCRITSAISNKPDNGLGDGNTARGIGSVSANGLGISLRAERSGDGPGRICALTVICSDGVGNIATKSTTVTVPKSQGK